MGCGGSKGDARTPGDDGDIEGKRVNKQGKAVNQYDRDDKRPEDNEAMAKLFEVESAGGGEQIMAVKPWLGAIKPPSNPPPLQNSAPSVAFDLEYVYGYRVFDSRQNLFYTSNPGNVVYMVAALGVVLNKDQNRQRFFGAGLLSQAKGHSDDITALAIAPDRDTVATGEVGASPKILIWSASNPEAAPKASCSLGRGRRGVSCLGFSHDGRYVAAADLHNDHYVSVWDTANGTRVAEAKGGPDKILDLAWNHSSHSFVTAGIKHIYFWELKNGLLESQKGLFGQAGEQSNMTSAGWLADGTAVTGAANGQLYHWRGRELQKTYAVHGAGMPVHALAIIQDRIFSGGKDNKLIELNSSLTKVKEHVLDSYPRAVDMHNNNILVGTRDGRITEIRPDGSKVTLMESHNDGEVWGMSLTSDGLVVTTADDNQIKAWNPSQRKCVATGTIDSTKGPQRKAGSGASTLATTGVNQQARGVAVNTSNGHVAIGHNDGRVTIRTSASNLNTTVATLNDAKEWIEVIHFSPDNSRLAVGSHDNFVYIYEVGTGYKLQHKLSGHHSFITALDWSVDGTALHTTSGDYELLFWDANTGKQVPDGATKFMDEHWHNWSCPLGWPVRGIFGTVIDYTHINRVHRSPNGQFVAVGNDWGLVEVFGFPNSEGARSVAYRGHSEHVMNVKWSANGDYLFSAGGYDQAVMQWKKR
jgi:microtubule-associated protein-like 6